MNCAKAISTLHVSRGYTSLKSVLAGQAPRSRITNDIVLLDKCRSTYRVDELCLPFTVVRYSHSESRKRPRWDRVGYQHEKKIAEIKDRFDSNFDINEFFRGVAQTFVNVTNCISEKKDDELESILSPGALWYAQWIRDESTHTDTCYSEVIFPTKETDIFSLVINNVEIDDLDSTGNRKSTVDITVTVTYGKNHRVIFGIPDSYLCSFAIFKFQRTFVDQAACSDWFIDRLQYYPPR